MARSKHIFNLITRPAPWADFLYVLQLEEYYPKEYSRFVRKFWWRRNIQEKGKVHWTGRLRLTALIALGGFYGLWAIILGAFFGVPLLLLFYVSHLLIPFVIGIANIIALPVVKRQKSKAISKAKEFRTSNLSNTHIIAVAGSYGKTTSKHLLVSLLKYTHTVETTPGNINTTLGVAQWLPTLTKRPDILIIEMDSYGPGELTEMCEYLEPDSLLLTSVGDQHMMRFGTKAVLEKALLEPLAFTNGKQGIQVIPQSVTTKLPGVIKVEDTLTYHGETLTILSQPNSVTANLAKVLRVVEYFNVPARIVKDEIEHLVLPERRRQLSLMHGWRVIDDSYNISLETLKSGLEYGSSIAKTEGRAYIVLTGGIPEAGVDEKALHTDMANLLNTYADEVVFLDSIYAPLTVTHLTKPTIYSPNLRNITDALTHLHSSHTPDEVLIHVFPELTDLSYV
jgi:UDP-N-acetylmuramoyl-tripeptide--D-alanyl-D-alanine ligase